MLPARAWALMLPPPVVMTYPAPTVISWPATKHYVAGFGLDITAKAVAVRAAIQVDTANDPN